MAVEAPVLKSKLQHCWRWVRIPAILYLAICLLMMALENRLVYPRPATPTSGAFRVSQANQSDIFFEAADGTSLHGWFFAHDQPHCAILYCHGNGEDVSSNAAYMDFLRQKMQASIFLFDYRGYGKSTGSPTEAGVIIDGLAAQRWLANKLQINTDEIVLMGRSLGGGVAVALAEQQGARALVLQNTFANMSEVAAEKYFWLPVRWIMRNQFPSDERISQYKGPLLQVHGTKDRLIPYTQGEQLFAAAPSKSKQWVKNEGGTHNSRLPGHYYLTLARFLDALPRLNQEE